MEKNTVIAWREYYVIGTSNRYRVEIFAPYQPIDASGGWRCEIKIKGEGVPEGLEEIEPGGSDSYQALVLAFKMAKAMIESLNKHLNFGLRLYNDSDDNLFLD